MQAALLARVWLIRKQPALSLEILLVVGPRRSRGVVRDQERRTVSEPPEVVLHLRGEERL